MERKGVLRLFTIPACIVIYALWQGWRAVDLFDGDAGVVLRLLLAVVALLLAGVALLVVGAATLLCSTSARSSRRSQATLIRKFTLCRRLLPLFMVGEIVACGLAVICLALSEVIWIVSHIGGAGGIKLVIIILLAVGAIFWMLFKSLISIRKCFSIFKPEDSEICGASISEAQAPVLWQWIRTLTQRGQLTVPDNIVVGLFDCFYVTANAVQIEEGERLTGNTLYLPLTYMALLDEAEAAAVIGHELGHFTGEDTQYSLRFLPLYAGIQNSLEHIANNAQGVSWIDRLVLRPSLDMGVWFLQTFHETVRHWSRIREYAADEMGSKVSSPTAFASALLRISALDAPVSRYLDDVTRGRIVSDNWISGLSAVLQKSGSLELQNSLDSEIAHPMDSHPTTRDRILSLAVSPDDELLARAARPVAAGDGDFLRSLFTDADALCTSLSQAILAQITPRREAFRQALEEEAELATDSVAFWMGASASWLITITGILMFLGGGYLVLFQTVSEWCWLIPFGGIALGMLGKVTLQRTRQPLFVLTKDCLTSAWLPQPLPLKHVSSFNLMMISSSMMIEFFIDDEYQPNLTTKRFMQVIRFNPRKRTVAIVVSGRLLREQDGKKVKLETEALLELIGQYLASAHARAELANF